MIAQSIEVRSIEESLKHAHDAVGRAESVIARMTCALTGLEQGPEVAHESPYDGLVGSADRLAGRAESLIKDLERVHSRLIGSKFPPRTDKETEWADANTTGKHQ